MILQLRIPSYLPVGSRWSGANASQKESLLKHMIQLIFVPLPCSLVFFFIFFYLYVQTWAHKRACARVCQLPCLLYRCLINRNTEIHLGYRCKSEIKSSMYQWADMGLNGKQNWPSLALQSPRSDCFRNFWVIKILTSQSIFRSSLIIHLRFLCEFRSILCNVFIHQSDVLHTCNFSNINKFSFDKKSFPNNNTQRDLI